MNFGWSRRGKGGSCVKGMVQDWIGQKKNTNYAIATNPTYFCCNKGLIRAMLPIYYRTSSLTLWHISGLKEALEMIIKHQTALKF